MTNACTLIMSESVTERPPDKVGRRSGTAIRAVVVSCSLLSFAASNALAQLSPATYSGIVTSDNTPNPVIRQFLTTPGTLTVSQPGPVPDPATITLRTVGPSISASATSFPLVSGLSNANSESLGGITYFVEIVGPPGNVLTDITAIGGVSSTNGFSNVIAAASVSVNGVYVHCAVDPAHENQTCNGQSFSGTTQSIFAANTPIEVVLIADASAYYPMVGTVSASVDPIFSIDPSVPNASSYSVLVSPGITQAAGPTNFYALTPCRLIDTRGPAAPLGGPALAGATIRPFVVAGSCGIPSSAQAISVNLTVTQSTAAGDLRVYAGGTALPLVSAINYHVGQTRANNAIVSLGASGDLSVRCDQAGGTAQFIVDVNGYFQ